MRYFQIENDYEPKAIGCYPQSCKMGCGYNHDRKDSINYVHVNEIPSFAPFTGCFVLQQNALLTDFISSALLTTGFIVNEKVKQLLTHFNLGKHVFFPTKISHGHITYEDYFWLIFEPIDLTTHIDFNLSEFYLTDFNGIEKKILHLNGAEELKNVTKNVSEETNGRDKIKSPLLHINTNIQYLDLLELPISPYDILISERLHSQLVQNNITGVKFQEKNNLKMIHSKS